MPMYEYKCQQCGSVFELIQKFSDEPLQTHSGCGGVVERLVSAPALQFKGSGWYITDYAKSGSLPAKPGKESTSDSGESKPANSQPAADSGSTGNSASSKSESSSSPAPAASTSDK